MPAVPTSTSSARWGHHRETATRLCRGVDWTVLTAAEVDCLWLNKLSSPTRTEREIAERYGVSSPCVHKHVTKALAKVARAGIGPPTPPEPVSPRLCPRCPHVRVPCPECIDALIRTPPVVMGGRKAPSGRPPQS